MRGLLRTAGLGVFLLCGAVLGGLEACGTSTDSSTFGNSGRTRTGIGVGDASIGDGGPILFVPEGGSGDGGVTSSLYFDPPSATIVIDGTGTKTAQLALKSVAPSGVTSVVTPASVAFDRPDLATVTASNPVVATAPSGAGTPYAGTGTIHAIYQGVEATATVTVQVKIVTYGAGLTPSSPAVATLSGAQFGPAGVTLADGGAVAADPSAKLLYPYDRTVWPLGLTSPRIMWNAPKAGEVYRLHYQEKNYSFDGYYTLGSLPAWMTLDQTTWDRLTASSDAANGPDPLAFSMLRTDGTNVYATASETWTIAPESLRGAIYYWTASQASRSAPRVGHISRFQPGTGATPQPLNNGACMGCHAVNAQGTILVADIDDNLESQYTQGFTRPAGVGVPSVAPYDNWSGTRPWASFDITRPASPLLYQSNKFGADIALTPDGKYVVFGGRADDRGMPVSVPGSKIISLGDPLTGNVLATSGLDQVVLHANETNLEMPAFSPDGTKLAVIESNNGGDPDNVIPYTPEMISYLSFNEGAVGGPSFDPTLHVVVDQVGLLSAGITIPQGLGYPSFTPDSKAVAFHAGDTSTGCHPDPLGCDDPSPDDGDLYLATLAGGAPVRLAAADDPPDPGDHYASVEPTFNPVVRGGYSWVVFTSMRNWGNYGWPNAGALPPDAGPDSHVNAKRRLWVAAIDTTLGAVDPSHPAIYLEGQEDTPNMRGFWTLASCIATPTVGGADGGAAAGDGGAGGSDAGDAGGACTNGFECCSGFCQGGICVDVSKVSCVGVGGACTSSSDCCNSGVVQCSNGQCIAHIPR
jgi:hypothetical protein